MFDYYKAPPDKVFKNIKEEATKIWKTYDNTYGYVDGKLSRIKDLENIRDNAWSMIGMFDPVNTRKLYTAVNEDTKNELDKLFAQNNLI